MIVGKDVNVNATSRVFSGFWLFVILTVNSDFGKGEDLLDVLIALVSRLHQ